MGKLTYKIDRIVSQNNILDLGLKTGVNLQLVNGEGLSGISKYIQPSTVLKYPEGAATYNLPGAVDTFINDYYSDSNSGGYLRITSGIYTDRRVLATAGFVEKATALAEIDVYNWLSQHYLTAEGRISITPADTGDTATSPKKKISLSPLYTSTSVFDTTTIGSNTAAQTIAYDSTRSRVVAGELNSNNTALADSPTLFITGIEFDNYGAIKKVNVRQVSTADLNVSGNLDNYRNWILTDGTTSANIVSGYDTNNNADSTKALSVSASAPLTAAVTQTSSGGATLSLALNYGTGLRIDNTSGANLLDLATVDSSTSGDNDALYKITVDGYGRITNKTLISQVSTDLLPTLAHDTSGIVNHIQQSNNASSALGHSNSSTDSNDTTHFLVDNGTSVQWAKVPFDSMYVDYPTIQSGNTKNYYLVGVDTASAGLYTGHAKNDVYISGSDGYLHAVVSGDGSHLTSLNASNISTGTLSNSRLDIETASTGLRAILGLSAVTHTSSGNSYGADQIVITDGSGGLKLVPSTTGSTITTSEQVSIGVLSAPIENGAISSSNAAKIGWRDIRTLVTNIVASEGGMRFKGVIGTNSQSEVTWTSVVGNFQKGDFYKIGDMSSMTPAENWDLGGYKDELEVGDTLVAVKDFDATYSTASVNVKRTYWAPIQGNLKNAVTYNNSSITNSASYVVPVTTGTTTYLNGFTATGTVGENNNITWAINAKAAAANTADAIPSHTLWGQSFDGTNNVTGTLSDVESITIANDNNTHNLGSNTKAFDNIFVYNIKGTGSGDTAVVPHLFGLADEASKVTNTLTLKLSDNDANPIVYDGSAAKEFVFNVSTLNLFNDVAADSANSGQTGNVVTGVSLSRDATDNTKLIYTVTKDYVVDTINSDILNVTSSDGTRTIGWYAGKSNGKLRFYAPTAITGNHPSGTSTLCLDGNLLASNLDVVFASGDARHVAPKIKSSDAKKAVSSNVHLLVASDADSDGQSRFQESTAFVNSNSVGNQSTMWSSSSEGIQVPTAIQVKALVDSVKTEIAAQEKVECARINFSFGTISLGGSGNSATAARHVIPAGAIVDHIDIHIISAYSSTATFSLSAGNTVIIGTSAGDLIDITEADTVYSYKYSKKLTLTGEFNPVINIGESVSQESPNQGYGTCYIYYTAIPNGDGTAEPTVVGYAS